MLFERQKRLLALLDALGGEVGRLDFQKLLLLYCHGVEAKPTYEFVPYRYGGFSFTSYDDKRRLTRQGFLENEEPTWKLTLAGRLAADVPPPARNQMTQFALRYHNLRGNALVAETYRRYPYYAIRSEISDQVLLGDIPALMAIAAARPASAKPGLITIGYEQRSFEAYLNCLLQAGVTLLCDVRRNPFSHKYGFSKGTLRKGCEGIGICYEHLPELGIPSAQRQGLETQTDYDALFEAYKGDSLPKQIVALEKIRNWVQQGHRVALTCFERRAEQCHRRCVADELARRWGDVLKPEHF